MTKRTVALLLLIAALGFGLLVAIRYSEWFGLDNRTSLVVTEPPRIEQVVAQGRLLPRGGIVNVPLPPGQRVEALLVAEGDSVTAGQTELVKLAGQDLLQLQVKLAAAKKTDAEAEIDQKIVAAEINLRSAEAAREAARLNLEQLDSRDDAALAARQIATARGKLDRLQQLADDPQTARFVARQQLDDQSLVLERAESDQDRGELTLRQAKETAKLALENAQLNVESAQRSLELANKLRSGNQSLALAETIAEAQWNNSRIFAPADGTVLKIFVKPGEAAVNAPLLQLGNLAQMECVAEVNERIIRQVRIGQRVKITSPALARDLSGTVRKIGRIVGGGTLPNPNPLAMVDVKTIDVHVDVDAGDVTDAAALVHLQVTVQIQPNETPAGADSATEPAPAR
jgi:HlyD family secretion protein